MTIDEAIQHCEEVAEEQDKLCKRYDDASGYTRSHNEDIRTTDAKRCEECAKEHRQLAEWLKELKKLRKVFISGAFDMAIEVLGQTDALDKIRAEIDRQQKWLLQAGYTMYNVDIAFDAIKAVVAESEDRT